MTDMKVDHNLFTKLTHLNNLVADEDTKTLYYEETIIKDDNYYSHLCSYNPITNTKSECLPYQKNLAYYFYQGKPHLKDSKILNFSEENPSEVINIDQNRILLIFDKNLDNKIKEDIFVYTSYPLYQDNNLISTYRRLYLYDLIAHELIPLSEQYQDINKYYYEEEKVLFSTISYQDNLTRIESIYEYDLKTKTCLKLAEENLTISYLFYFAKKPSFIASCNDSLSLYSYLNKRFYRLYEKPLKLNAFTSDLYIKNNNNFFKYQDKHYLIAQQSGSSNIYLITTKDFELLMPFEGAILSAAFLANTLYFIALDNSGAQLYSYKHEKITPLTSNNKACLLNYYLAPYKELKVIETTTKNYILLPKDYNSSKQYPALLAINDNPNKPYLPTLNNTLQYLVSEGYVVIVATPYNDLNNFKWGEDDFATILKILRTAREKYQNIDYKRVGVLGSNVGGFLGAWLISHTNLFAGATLINPLLNWPDFLFGTSEGLKLIKQASKDAYTSLNNYWDKSLLKYVDNIKTPTLLLQAQNSYDYTYEQTLAFYSALKRNNTQTKLVFFRNEKDNPLNSKDIEKHKYCLQEIKVFFNKIIQP